MRYFRENIQRMPGYIPGEQPKNGGHIKLNTNENPYPPSPRVIDRINACLTRDFLSLYPPPLCDGLRKQISRVFGIPEEWILVGNGSDELLNLAFRAFLDPKDTVAYPVPTYTLYRTLAQIQGAEPLEIPFHKDFALPNEFIGASASLKILCNPNSPSGTYISNQQVQTLVENSNCPVLVDEAYVDFAEENALPLLNKHSNMLIARTLSKSFSLAGIRVGFVCAHPDIVEGLIKVKDSYNVSRLSQEAALAALQDIPYMLSNVEKIRKIRDKVSNDFRQLGFEVFPSQANFILVRQKGKDLGWLYGKLREERILIRFFNDLPDSLRISIGSKDEMDQLVHAVVRLTKKSSP